MIKFYISEILVFTEEDKNFDQTDRQNLLLAEIKKYLNKEKKFSLQPQWQIFNQDFESFKIEEARRLNNEASLSSSFKGGEERVFILLNFETASNEAQNACLKIIEESPANTLLLIPVFSKQNLLPTILSRCVVKNINLKSLEPSLVAKNTETIALPNNYSQAIRLAEANKSKIAALSLVKRLSNQLDQSNWQQRQILALCQQQLLGNFNPSLTLEQAFFQLIKNSVK